MEKNGSEAVRVEGGFAWNIQEEEKGIHLRNAEAAVIKWIEDGRMERFDDAAFDEQNATRRWMEQTDDRRATFGRGEGVEHDEEHYRTMPVKVKQLSLPRVESKLEL